LGSTERPRSPFSARPKDVDDDRQPHHDLGGRDDQHEEHDHLPAEVAPDPSERHKRKVDGVQHQLDAHEEN